MTNPDTSTLNGALEQLGITMADNLVTMGVSDADPTDGLTTLAGKILDIGPTPPTPTPASLDLSLTAGKQILSYVDRASGNEYATLSALVLDENDDPLPGVSVSIYKDNVLWYTAETGAGGTISKTYDSEGVGDVSFHAVCGSLVTESFAIEDCTYYHESAFTSTQNNFNVSLPSSFELSFTTKRTSNGGNSSYLEIGGDTGNTALFGQLGSSGESILRIYNSEGSSGYSDTSLGNNLINADTSYSWTKNGSNHTVVMNTTSKTTTNSLTHSKIRKLSITNNKIEKLKIKPL